MNAAILKGMTGFSIFEFLQSPLDNLCKANLITYAKQTILKLQS